MPEGNPAASASGEYQVRNNRSVNCMIVVEIVDTTSGSEKSRTRRDVEKFSHDRAVSATHRTNVGSARGSVGGSSSNP